MTGQGLTDLIDHLILDYDSFRGRRTIEHRCETVRILLRKLSMQPQYSNMQILPTSDRCTVEFYPLIPGICA